MVESFHIERKNFSDSFPLCLFNARTFTREEKFYTSFHSYLKLRNRRFRKITNFSFLTTLVVPVLEHLRDTHTRREDIYFSRTIFATTLWSRKMQLTSTLSAYYRFFERIPFYSLSTSLLPLLFQTIIITSITCDTCNYFSRPRNAGRQTALPVSVYDYDYVSPFDSNAAFSFEGIIRDCTPLSTC